MSGFEGHSIWPDNSRFCDNFVLGTVAVDHEGDVCKHDVGCEPVLPVQAALQGLSLCIVVGAW